MESGVSKPEELNSGRLVEKGASLNDPNMSKISSLLAIVSKYVGKIKRPTLRKKRTKLVELRTEAQSRGDP